MEPDITQVSPDDLAAAVDAVRRWDQANGGGTRTKDVAPGTPTHVVGHGLNGLWSHPGIEPRVLNAMVLPRMGILDVLPSRTSVVDNPIYELMTGVTDETGSERPTPCDVSPVAGLMKGCKRMLPWGVFSRDTRVIDIRTLGRQRDRSDFLDLDFVNNPLRGDSSVPTLPGADVQGSGPLRTEIGKALFEFAVNWKRIFAPRVWTANPSNNNAGGGYKEPYGLDYQINDGYRDAETGTACPAADSLVRDFNSAEVVASSATLIREVAAIIRYLEMKAVMAAAAPLELALVMREEMFWEISEIWACAYYVTRCATTTETTDAKAMIDMRDAMRNENYLLINGKKYRVILDQTVTETALAGGAYKGTIYFVPLRIMTDPQRGGGQPVTFFEYLDQDRPNGPMAGARIMAPNQFYTTNNGRYLWHWRPSNNGCVQGSAETEWRIIVEAPFLAARLDNVKYVPRIHTQGWDPDYSFYLDGGQTTRVDGSFYSPTS